MQKIASSASPGPDQPVCAEDQWYKIARISCYSILIFIGLVWAASSDLVAMPIQFELAARFYRIFRLWQDFSLVKLLQLPWWVAETGLVPVFLLAAPFLGLLGLNAFAIQLPAVLWTVLGLWLFEKSFENRWEGLLAVALMAFGNELTAVAYRVPSGAYTQIVLPFGALAFLYSRFRRMQHKPGSLALASYGLAPPLLAIMQPTLAPGILAAVVFLIFELDSGKRRLYLPALIQGGILGLVLIAPILTTQFFPGSRHVMPSVEFFRNLVWFFADDFARFTKVRGALWSGHLLMIVSLMAHVWAFRRFGPKRDPFLSMMTVSGLVTLLWICSSMHYRPWDTVGDAMARRQMLMVWPYWCVLLSRFVVTGVREFLPHLRELGRRLICWIVRGVVFGILVADFVLVIGSVNYFQIGAALKVPLKNPLGEIIVEHLVQGATLAVPQVQTALGNLETPLRETLAFYLSHGILWNPDGTTPAEVVERAAFYPAELREPFLTGLGFFACEGSIRNAYDVAAQFPEAYPVISQEYAQYIKSGCDLARRWRRGEGYFPYLAWPIQDQFVETRDGLLFESVGIYRSTPLQSIRGKWPWNSRQPIPRHK